MYYSLFVRYERNQSKAIPRTQKVFNFDSRISWLIQSNDLQKSRNKEIQHYQSLYAYTRQSRCIKLGGETDTAIR